MLAKNINSSVGTEQGGAFSSLILQLFCNLGFRNFLIQFQSKCLINLRFVDGSLLIVDLLKGALLVRWVLMCHCSCGILALPDLI